MPKVFHKPNAVPGGPAIIGFECPGCQFDHHVSTDRTTRPYWTVNDDMERPTMSPSIVVAWEYAGKKMRCHSFVRDGNIEFLDDCTHHLAGKTVILPDV